MNTKLPEKLKYKINIFKKIIVNGKQLKITNNKNIYKTRKISIMLAASFRRQPYHFVPIDHCLVHFYVIVKCILLIIFYFISCY